jgi:surfactin synthase thioesterase subunit
LNSVAQPELTLFCVPYAGGNAHIYRSWSNWVSPNVALYGVELPGRGTRFGEACRVELRALAMELGHAIVRQGSTPFALFGHSMGALLAFEAGLWLERQGRTPRAVFVSARAPAHTPRRHELMHVLETAALQARLAQYGGLPQLLLDTPDLWRVYEPILRADFALCELHEHTQGERLGCPLEVLSATDDRTVEFDDVVRWPELSRGSCRFHDFTGGHFFIRSNEGEVVRTVMNRLATASPHWGEGTKDGQRASSSTAVNGGSAGNNLSDG